MAVEDKGFRPGMGPLSKRAGGKRLFRVQLAQGGVRLKHAGIVAEYLPPDSDRLRIEPILGEDPRQPGELLVGGPKVVEPQVEIADVIDRDRVLRL